MSWSGFIGGALVGVGVADWDVPLAVASGGVGQGDYVAARLPPPAMLLTRLAGDTITPTLMLLALAQFPLYGGVTLTSRGDPEPVPNAGASRARRRVMRR
jgi:hypothetical protein